MQAGWRRADIGYRLSWADFKDFVVWLPATGESALYRAQKPNSWWVTPQLQVLAGLLYAAEGANWQRGGGKGNAPQPMKFPEDRKVRVKNADDLARRRDALKRKRG